MQSINFWNGNKSEARQNYELALIQACLRATESVYQPVTLEVDKTDYPKAIDESLIFDKGADVLVTVAGNIKFDGIQKFVVPQPLTKGLLGYRLLVVRDASLTTFAQLKDPAQLQKAKIGIPNTWADADLFRHNGYQVVEQGTLDELFLSLKKGAFDYVALGINEMEDIFDHLAAPLGGLSIQPSLMLYYPFPLVFYVNPKNCELAKRLEKGLHMLLNSGEFEVIFKRFHGNLVSRLNLSSRTIFTLVNPLLPKDMADFSATLLS